MVVLKTSKELSDMKLSCKISAQALKLAGELIKPGVSTAYVDQMLHEFIVSQGAKPTFLGYGGFPASCCISVNDEVIHGIPSGRVIEEGDIVSVDVGAAINGYTGDNAATFAAGKSFRRSTENHGRYKRMSLPCNRGSPAGQPLGRCRICGRILCQKLWLCGSPGLCGTRCRQKAARVTIHSKLRHTRTWTQAPAGHDIGNRADDQRKGQRGCG